MLYYKHKLINKEKAKHKIMETNNTEAVTFDDILSLATWNRTRSTSELRSFINRRNDFIDVEDFDLT